MMAGRGASRPGAWLSGGAVHRSPVARSVLRPAATPPGTGARQVAVAPDGLLRQMPPAWCSGLVE